MAGRGRVVQSSMSMVVNGRARGEQFSAVYRINGYPWMLRASEVGKGNTRQLSLICLKSCESELWECGVKIVYPEIFQDTFDLKSWEGSHEVPVTIDQIFKVVVRIEVTGDGEKCNTYPMSGPPDVSLVFEGTNEKIPVNKESLLSKSRFFENLFYGDLRKMNEKEFTIDNVEYEEFSNIIKLLYRLEGATLTDENVHRVLELAYDLKLKIIGDKVMTFLISPSCSLSIDEKLFITEEYNLPFLRSYVFKKYNYDLVEELGHTPDFEEISKDTLGELLSNIDMDIVFHD